MAVRSSLGTSLAVALVLVLAVSPVAPAQGGRKPQRREVTFDYAGPAAGFIMRNIGTTVVSCEPPTTLGCTTIPIKPNERFLSIWAADSTGQRTGGYVTDQRFDTIGYFCGSAERMPIFTTEVTVVMVNGICEDGEPVVATTGSARVLFSDR